MILVHRFAAFVLALLPAVGQAAEPEFETGELLVRWKQPAVLRLDRQVIQRVTGPLLRADRAVDERTLLYRTGDASQEATLRTLAALRANPDVELAEPNFIRRRYLIPNDPLYPQQWYLKSVRMEDAWDRLTGSPHVVVAVVDTGIKAAHPDLAGRLLPGWDFISSPESGGDGDGWDSNSNDEGTDGMESSALHGTHIAGIIGAVSNNGKGTVGGITGVNWGCKILPVRTLGIVRGKGTDADIAAGIRWAAGVPVPGVPINPTPARVINLSFGGPGYGAVLEAAVIEAIRNGAIVVVAAGNQGQEGSDIFPAAIQGVVTVGASDYYGKRAPYSNFGSVVDVMAPGGDTSQTFIIGNEPHPAGVLSTMYESMTSTWTYHYLEGTSQAAPIVSGIVALMLDVNADLDNTEVKRILRSTANARSMCDEGCGAGLVNADASLAMTRGEILPATNPGPEVCPGPKCVPTGTVTGSCSVGEGSVPRAEAVWLLVLLGLALTRRLRQT